MHKLDLDTLTKERLENSVDQATFNLGDELNRQKNVQIAELTDSQAHCIVHDKRNFHVHLKVDAQHLFLKCSCSHASRGLICEHEVAAYLGVQDQLTKSLPPVWTEKIQNLNTLLSENPSIAISQSYYLFFSLQKDPSQSFQTWRVEPYTLFAGAFSAKNVDQETVEITWDDVFQGGSDLINKLRPVIHPLNTSDCLNGGSAAASLANLILRIKNANLKNARFPIEDLLPLLRQNKVFLASGDTKSPIMIPLHFIPERAALKLHIFRNEKTLSVNPMIEFDDQVRIIDNDEFEVIHPAPLWMLYENGIFELHRNHSEQNLRNILAVRNTAIPPEEESYFLDHYLLELAGEIEICGNAVKWEEGHFDPIPRIYLNERNAELLIQLRFAYQDFEVDYNPNFPDVSIQQVERSWNLIRLKRQPITEQRWRDLLVSSSYGLKRAPFPNEKSQFQLRSRTHPATFLLDSLPRLADEGMEIFGEERLRSARVNRNTPTISFHVSSGIDWFDLRTLVNFGDLEVPLKEIRRVIRKQERFVKLSDGSIGEIPAEWLEHYSHLFAVGDVQEDSLRFSRHQISLLDQAVETAHHTEMDEEFARRRAGLKLLRNEDFLGISQKKLPEGFFGELRPYQVAGYNWLHFLRDFQLGGCLADDMGLGKTIQTLALFLSIYHPQDPSLRPASASLLVVPRSLLINWQREAARFTPNLKFFEFFDSNREKNLPVFDQQDVIITTYGILLRDIQFLNQYEFHYAVLDESQSIKNPLSQTARAAQLIRSENRLVLTGTPIENSTSELWSQFTFLNPGLLGNLKYFKNEFGVPIEKNRDTASINRLKQILYPLILRRTKEQVAPELPPRTERILYCDMENAQRKLYQRTRDTYRSMLLDMVDKGELNGGQIRILEGLLRLRQIANHPVLVDEKFHGSSGKFELLIGTLETLKSEGHKTLVFSQFVSMLTIVRKALDDKKYPLQLLGWTDQYASVSG